MKKITQYLIGSRMTITLVGVYYVIKEKEDGYLVVSANELTKDNCTIKFLEKSLVVPKASLKSVEVKSSGYFYVLDEVEPETIKEKLKDAGISEETKNYQDLIASIKYQQNLVTAYQEHLAVMEEAYEDLRKERQRILEAIEYTSSLLKLWTEKGGDLNERKGDSKKTI